MGAPSGYNECRTRGPREGGEGIGSRPARRADEANERAKGRAGARKTSRNSGDSFWITTAWLDRLPTYGRNAMRRGQVGGQRFRSGRAAVSGRNAQRERGGVERMYNPGTSESGHGKSFGYRKARSRNVAVRTSDRSSLMRTSYRPSASLAATLALPIVPGKSTVCAGGEPKCVPNASLAALSAAICFSSARRCARAALLGLGGRWGCG